MTAPVTTSERKERRRKDGKCSQCKRKPAVGDAFCSNICARAFHGQPVNDTELNRKPSTYRQKQMIPTYLFDKRNA